MTQKQNNEPGDEFDRIMIPAFLARPFERLGGRPLPAPPAGRAGSSADAGPDRPRYADDETENPDAASADDEQPAPRAWWAGYRGKLLLYGAGTLVMVFLQSRG
ncbi:hypothetical protein [Cryobacterium sp.]|jgi:hypothetical protein|uniref:hypothetical protein n=1 Tax=Cryobacterium sp. TaxID=1926290 RepID=UPI00260CA888|nr:hypothetical protein [Cryobacterium sp.]MCU1447237.1 hypothetical protein [Cryobacterium sp.]